MGLTPSFWKNTHVLITGHTGFMGSWLSQWLLDLGAIVSGISLPLPTSDTPHLFKDSALNGSCENYFFDIRDRHRLQSTIQSINPSIVFHLAAQPIVLESYASPIKTLETNILGTSYLLDSLKTCTNVKHILIITSDKCYSNTTETTTPFVEDCALGGLDPYSASKACQDIISQAFYASYFKQKNVGLTTIRAGNIIGGGDWAQDRIIPDCARAIQNNSPITLRNPNSIRPWQYILDVLYGYLLLSERIYSSTQKYSGPWNFGPLHSSTVTVKELVNLYLQHCTFSLDVISETPTYYESPRLLLDSSKSNTLLGWSTHYSIKKTLQETASFYNTYSKTSNSTMMQTAISQYMKGL
jgi:CDP-glucose 4,6-dehydratase